MKLSDMEIDKMSLPERGLRLQCESMKLEIADLTEKNDSLMALARFGRWALDQAVSLEKSKFSVEDANAIDAKATELGLGYMEDMGTYEVFVETDKAKVLDVDH